MFSVKMIIEERNKDMNTHIDKKEEALANFYSNSEKYQEQIIEWINKHIHKRMGYSDIVKNGYVVLQLDGDRCFNRFDYIPLIDSELYNNFTPIEIYHLIFSQQKMKNEFEKNGYCFEIKRSKYVHSDYSCTFNAYDNYLIISTKKTRKSWRYYFNALSICSSSILNK